MLVGIPVMYMLNELLTGPLNFCFVLWNPTSVYIQFALCHLYFCSFNWCECISFVWLVWLLSFSPAGFYLFCCCNELLSLRDQYVLTLSFCTWLVCVCLCVVKCVCVWAEWCSVREDNVIQPQSSKTVGGFNRPWSWHTGRTDETRAPPQAWEHGEGRL